jgi:hypothetical protein
MSTLLLVMPGYDLAVGKSLGRTSGGDKGVRRLAGYGLERLTPVDKMSAYCEQK